VTPKVEDATPPNPSPLSDDRTRIYGSSRRFRYVGPDRICGARLSPVGVVPIIRCGRIVPAQRRSGCCERHKVRIWTDARPRINPGQARLPFDPDGQPVPKVNGTVAPVARKRLAGKALNVLERLRKGPATNADLLAVGGFRFGARVMEVREHLRWFHGREREWNPIAVTEHHASGLAVYTLHEAE
jgi:hypothetical protein